MRHCLNKTSAMQDHLSAVENQNCAVLTHQEDSHYLPLIEWNENKLMIDCLENKCLPEGQW